MADTFIGSTEEKLIDEYEGQGLPHYSALQFKRADLLRQLNDTDRRILAAERDGFDTTQMKRDWLDRLHDFDAVCRALNGLK